MHEPEITIIGGFTARFASNHQFPPWIARIHRPPHHMLYNATTTYIIVIVAEVEPLVTVRPHVDSVTSVSGIVRKALEGTLKISVIYSIARYSYSYHKGTDVATIPLSFR